MKATLTWTMLLATLVPASAQVLSITPASDTAHIGRVFGTPTNENVQYTLTNLTNRPQGYILEWDPNAVPLSDFRVDGRRDPVQVGVVPAFQSVTIDARANFAPTPTVGTHTLQFYTAGAVDPIVRRHHVDIGTTDISVTPETVEPFTIPYGSAEQYELAFEVTNNHTTEIPLSFSGASNLSEYIPPFFSLQGGASQTATVRFDNAILPLGGPYFDDVVIAEPGVDTIAFRTIEYYHGAYPSVDFDLPITDGNTTTSQIVVPHNICLADPNEPGPSIGVTINAVHTYIGDLTVSLESPDGHVVVLHNQTGGNADDIFRTYEYNDADGPGDMRDFGRTLAAGTWTLRITDSGAGDTGVLLNWLLRLPTSDTCAPKAGDTLVEVPTDEFTLIELPFETAFSASFTITDLPGNGTVVDPNVGFPQGAPYPISGPAVYYLPNGPGLDSFTYEVVQPDGQRASGTVMIEAGTRTTQYSEPLDSDPGWTTEGSWSFGMPLGAEGDPSGGVDGPNAYGYNLNGAYEPNLPETHLTTPPFDLGAVSGAQLRFQRWLGVEASNFDGASISGSRDGGATWEPIWMHDGGTLIDLAWTEVTYDISSFDGEPSVQFRWTMGTTDSSVQFAGWNIDEIEILGLAPSVCLFDTNGDRIADLNDLATILANFGTTTSFRSMGDLDQDAQVTLNDLAIVLAAFGQTC